MYSKGIGGEEYDREAVRWLNVAAENGFEPAKELLANIKKNSIFQDLSRIYRKIFAIVQDSPRIYR